MAKVTNTGISRIRTTVILLAVVIVASNQTAWIRLIVLQGPTVRVGAVRLTTRATAGQPDHSNAERETRAPVAQTQPRRARVEGKPNVRFPVPWNPRRRSLGADPRKILQSSF